jgi:hypothetical protein
LQTKYPKCQANPHYNQNMLLIRYTTKIYRNKSRMDRKKKENLQIPNVHLHYVFCFLSLLEWEHLKSPGHNLSSL